MKEILDTIPHREPFLFVDKIVEYTEDGIVTERTIRADEPQFEGHYPGNPIMPGVLLCEAALQSAAIYLVRKLKSEGEDQSDKTPIVSRIEAAKFKNMVKPGDTVQITVKYKKVMSQFHFLSAKVVKADGKTAVTLDFAIALL